MTNSKPQSKRDKATAKRRRQILEAAVECFCDLGYHQTGVREIAARAGVSLGNLYNYFPGKHEILAEIAALEQQENAQFLAILSKAGAADKLLVKFVTSYTKYLAQAENVILSLEITGEAIRQPDIANLFVANRQQLANALTKVLDRGTAEGVFRALPDSEETAQLVLSVIEGSAYRITLAQVKHRKVAKAAQSFIAAALLTR